ncbi:uncharacterized protein FMAN_01452 [Fusarium mangiferae]|uniref:DUF7918 domain-containing protein n=1 Tax=Fusarium mangiferae TaxID=192010 RepID=A0A1L7SFE5_FUSMA|nr:uncharacterized protein FMAN_01452 [Fusarium mangiferae]CVK84400.1 uncharacterized protein FMAN_01452 [Fusarium mangiferae]
MAVLDEVPHVTARVRVAGELATEYDPLDDEEAVVKLDKEGIKIPRKVCYVESKSGAEFAIEIAVSDKRNKLLEVPLSSSREEAIIISSGRVSPETWAKKPILGKFVFAPINTISGPTSADRLNEDLKRAETLGTIRLRLFTCRFKGTRPRKHHPCYSTSREDSTSREVEVAEKALKGKAISHTTTLAETTEKTSSRKVVTTDKRLMGEIFFRYRSYQALQHEMIIPRTPSPEPSATTGIDASALSLLTESDIRRLALERLRDTQIKNESSRVKREAEEASQSPRRWKFVRLDDGKETVDLTDD